MILNRVAKRQTFNAIPNMNWWKYTILLFFGFLGGAFTSFAGSGMDISIFMVLTLLFRISEKVATPTAVVLMATNSVFGVFWRGFIMQSIEMETWEFLSVTGPIVVFMAPIGATIGSHFHRIVLAALVIGLDTAALIGGFVVVRPLNPPLIGLSVGIIVGGLLSFVLMSYFGGKILDGVQTEEFGAEFSNDDDAPKENGITNAGFSLELNGKTNTSYL